MKIINIVDTIHPINIGIWQAAIATAGPLKSHYKVDTELWFPGQPDMELPYSPFLKDIKVFPLTDISEGYLRKLIKEKNLKSGITIIATHGCWRFPSKWGYRLKNIGFSWIACPHGMLEPWSVKQKWLKKKMYYTVFEKKYLNGADYIRAVGTPEYEHLSQQFKKVVKIPNGVSTLVQAMKPKDFSDRLFFLFMARLHHKKGVLPLVEAWIGSGLIHKKKYTLIIAGPDEGEKRHIDELLSQHPNINIILTGPLYGDEKIRILNKCHFYILPSQSEGFPTSVIEAMQHGLVPVITDGCNFPEAFESNCAVRTGASPEEIKNTLYCMQQKKPAYFSDISHRSIDLITEKFTNDRIAESQYRLYEKMLNQ